MLSERDRDLLMAAAQGDTFSTASNSGVARADRMKLQMLVTELRAISQMVVVVTSILNRLSDAEDSESLLLVLPIYLPGRPTVFHSLKCKDWSFPHDSYLTLLLQSFYQNLATAKRLTKKLYRPLPIAMHTHREAIVETWMALCEAVLAILSLASRISGDPTRKSGDDPLQRLLEQAKDGESPCISPEGAITVSSMAERRRFKRLNVVWSADVHSSTSTCKVDIENLSHGGITASGLTNADIGDDLEVELHSGRRLFGQLRWMSGTSAGISFNHPLTGCDPLILAAEEEDRIAFAMLNCADVEEEHGRRAS